MENYQKISRSLNSHKDFVSKSIVLRSGKIQGPKPQICPTRGLEKIRNGGRVLRTMWRKKKGTPAAREVRTSEAETPPEAPGDGPFGEKSVFG